MGAITKERRKEKLDEIFKRRGLFGEVERVSRWGPANVDLVWMLWGPVKGALTLDPNRSICY